MARRAGDRFTETAVWHSLGDVELEARELAAAKEIYLDALETARQIGAHRIACYCIGGLSAAAAADGDDALACRLWAAARALEETLRFRMRRGSRTRYERRLSALPVNSRTALSASLRPDAIVEAAVVALEPTKTHA